MNILLVIALVYFISVSGMSASNNPSEQPITKHTKTEIEPTTTGFISSSISTGMTRHSKPFPGTYTSSSSKRLESKPRLKDMICFKSVHGHEDMDIIEHIAAYCEKLSHLLGLNANMVLNIWEGVSSQVNCKKSIMKWLEGQGEDVSWRSFIEALEKLKLGTLSKQLLQEFNQSSTSLNQLNHFDRLSNLHHAKSSSDNQKTSIQGHPSSQLPKSEIEKKSDNNFRLQQCPNVVTMLKFYYINRQCPNCELEQQCFDFNTEVEPHSDNTIEVKMNNNNTGFLTPAVLPEQDKLTGVEPSPTIVFQQTINTILYQTNVTTMPKPSSVEVTSKINRSRNIFSKPQLLDMIYLESITGDEGINIIQEITRDCRKLGHILRLRKELVQNIWSTSPSEDGCQQIIVKWQEGQGPEPVTWEAFIKALERLGRRQLSNKLRKEFYQPSIPRNQPAHSSHQPPTLQDHPDPSNDQPSNVITGLEQHPNDGLRYCPNRFKWLRLFGMNVSKQCPIHSATGLEQSLGNITDLEKSSNGNFVFEIRPTSTTELGIQTTSHAGVFSYSNMEIEHIQDSSMTARNLSSKPEFVDIINFKTVRGEDIYILEQVTIECKGLGHILLVNEDVMRNIWNSLPHQDRCYATIENWLDGRGKGSVTWETLINAIERLGLGELSKKLYQEFYLTSHYKPSYSTNGRSISHIQPDISVAQPLNEWKLSTTDQSSYSDDQKHPSVDQELTSNQACSVTDQSFSKQKRPSSSTDQPSKTSGHGESMWLKQGSNAVIGLEFSDVSNGKEQCSISDNIEMEQCHNNLTNGIKQHSAFIISKQYLTAREPHPDRISKIETYPIAIRPEVNVSITYHLQKMVTIKLEDLISAHKCEDTQMLEVISSYFKKLSDLLKLIDLEVNNIRIALSLVQDKYKKFTGKKLEEQESNLKWEIYILAFDKLHLRKMSRNTWKEFSQPYSSYDRLCFFNDNLLVSYSQLDSLVTQAGVFYDQPALLSDQLPTADKKLSTDQLLWHNSLGSTIAQLSSLDDQSLGKINESCTVYSLYEYRQSLSTDRSPMLQCQPYPSSNKPPNSPYNRLSDQLSISHCHQNLSTSPPPIRSADQLPSSHNQETSSVNQETPSTDRLSRLHADEQSILQGKSDKLGNKLSSTYCGLQQGTASGMNKWSALMISIRNGHDRIVKLLLDNGAKINMQDRDGRCALMTASQAGKSEMVKILLEYKADVDMQDDNGWSALMMASQNGHSEIVKILLKNNAQVNMQEKDGRCALMIASRNGHDEIVRILLDYGAHVDLQDEDGSSALMMASQIGYNDLVKILLENKAHVDLQDDYRRSSLIYASQNGYDNVAKLLLGNGAQTDLQDKDGTSALMSGSQTGHAETVRLLLDHGAQVDLQREDNWSALMLASHNEHDEVVQILLECQGR